MTNNHASVSSLVETMANVYTTIVCDDVGYISGTVNCVVTYGNNGNVDASNTTMTITISTGVVIQSVSDNVCTIISTGGISCTIGTYPDGQQNTMTVVVQ